MSLNIQNVSDQLISHIFKNISDTDVESVLSIIGKIDPLKLNCEISYAGNLEFSETINKICKNNPSNHTAWKCFLLSKCFDAQISNEKSNSHSTHLTNLETIINDSTNMNETQIDTANDSSLTTNSSTNCLESINTCNNIDLLDNLESQDFEFDFDLLEDDTTNILQHSLNLNSITSNTTSDKANGTETIINEIGAPSQTTSNNSDVLHSAIIENNLFNNKIIDVHHQTDETSTVITKEGHSKIAVIPIKKRKSKRFSCKFCSEKFTRSVNFNRHVESVHTNKKVKCYKCEKLLFPRSDNIKRHLSSKRCKIK